MAKQTRSIQKKTLNAPDEVRTFDRGNVELATVGTVTFGRARFEPGWKWSESVKPIVKTDYCEAPHIQYHVSGRLRIRMADGSEEEFGPGDVGFFPAGTTCTWRHPDHFRKVAVLKESIWRPLGLGLKAWNKLLRTVGLTGKSPL